MRRFRNLASVVRSGVIILVGMLALAPGAHGADPHSVLTVRGSCSSFDPLFVSTPERPYLLRVSSPSSDLQLILNDDWELVTGEVRWFSVVDRSEDFSLIYYRCDTGEWTGDFYRIPDAPTSFSGVGAFNSYSSVVKSSQVAFRAPAGARYVATVRPRQGSVSLSLGRGGPVATFASRGTRALGFVRAGDDVVLGIAPNAGPPAIWDLSIAPRPLRLASASVSRHYARPGQLVTVKYRVTGDATLDAAVRRRAGVVRELAEATKITAGAHSLVWDGFDGSGKPVADGVYSIDLAASDTFGSSAKTTASVAIDTYPPKVIFQTPTVISPRRGIVFKIVDRLSGYRNGFVKVDGRSTGFQVTRAGADRFVLRPASGWTTGAHAVTVTAYDRLGNRSKAQKTFRVN